MITSHHKYTILPMGSFELRELQQCTEYVTRCNLARELGDCLEGDGATFKNRWIFRGTDMSNLKERIKANILGLSDRAFAHFAKLAEGHPKEAVRKILKSYRS